MRKIQSGFTLIELVMVIVIIGILAAVAVPKYMDLSSEANQAAVSGVAGAMASAAAINYAARKAGNASAAALSDCSGVAGFLLGGALPSGYTVATAAIAADATATCTVTHTTSGKTANFSATGVS